MSEDIKADVKLVPTVKSFDQKVFERFGGKLSEEEREYFLRKALPALKTRPRLEDSPDVGMSGQIDQDRADLLRKQAQAEINVDYLRAKIVESRLAGLMAEQKWLGQNAVVAETSEFDDWLRGADRVVEYQGEPPFRLIIDFTSESDSHRLGDEKLRPIFHSIETGLLGEVKYFRSAGDKKQHWLKKLPKVLICFEPATARRLADPKQADLENSWAKITCLLEIKKQIEFFMKYNANPARRGYRAGLAEEIAESYRHVLDLVKIIYLETIGNFVEKVLKIKMPQSGVEALLVKLEPMLIEKVSQRDRSAAALLKLVS